MSSGLVDLHCHLDLYPDHAQAVRQCEEMGVFTLAVTTTPKAWPRNNELAEKTRHVRAALGLHPQLVADRASEISLWEELLPQTRYVGEVGLDASPRYYKSFDLQKEVFARILRACARADDKILTVHSIRSAKAVLDMMEAHLAHSLSRVVLHWFTGTASEARRAIDMGCYFSINAEMLVGDKRRKLVSTLPRERLLTETDGPFTKVNGRASRPDDVQIVVDELAAIHGLTAAEEGNLILCNLRQLLR
jgi:TatD DNase family protein